MRTASKIIVGVALAGLAAAGGAAFTGTGLATGTSAGAAQFVGGSIDQAVTGATLNSIGYEYADTAAHTLVNGIILTFSDDSADNKTVTAVPSGGAGGTFTCVTPGTVLSGISHCTYNPVAGESGYLGLGSLKVSVN